ncbi:MAG: ATP-dependent helicase, partial [Deltaproteobacteria bacterium]|nr:ATP-dependent helicase [Deltaproteobacteria bacterium]
MRRKRHRKAKKHIIPIAENTLKIGLTPHITLNFSNALAKDEWPEALFALGANRSPESSPLVFFWSNFAADFIARLARMPENILPSSMEPPSVSELEKMAAKAPPMEGGEYLSAQSLETIWRELASWVDIKLKEQSITEFLHKHAPAWRRVGRLTFHLAENKANENFPFAFMVTYVPSLTLEGLERHSPIKNAITSYAAINDKDTLVRLLSPLRVAAEQLDWVRDLEREGKIYNAQLFEVNQAYRFLQDVPILEQCGLSVRIPHWWQKRTIAKVKVTVGEANVPIMGVDSILDWNVSLALGDEDLSRDEIFELLHKSNSEGLILFKGQWIEANKEELEQALNHWEHAKATAKDSGISFLQAMRLLSGISSDDVSKSGPELPELATSTKVEAGKAFKALLENLRSQEESQQPPELTATLRPYQKKGLYWLLSLTGLGLGACLADDMGLGKTIQILALLLCDKKRIFQLDPNAKHLPSLLVAPASLLANWKLESERFAPTLRINTYHQSATPKEKMLYWEKHTEDLLENSDLIITSYSLLARSYDFFKDLQFRFIILDEAQAIKNPATNQSRAVRGLKSMSRLVLTGTPIENRLSDLWSLYDFLNP